MKNKEAESLNTYMFIRVMNTLIFSGLIFFIYSNTSVQAANQNQSGSMEFAIIGDMPYVAKQKKEFSYLMSEINAADLAFVVHAGDFAFDGIGWKKSTKGLPPCSDKTFMDRLSLAQNSKHPFIFTPGDNDWTDCHRAKPRKYDPVERLAKLRQVFFKGDKSLGKRSLSLTRQSKDNEYAKFRENVRWTYAGVQFVTLHMVGSNNNLGRTLEMDDEYEERNLANLAWMSEAFEQAKNSGSKAIMIISQANPQFENNWSTIQKKRYLLGGLGIKASNKKEKRALMILLRSLRRRF